MARYPRDRYSLSWHEPQDRPGPGRRQRLVGMEHFPPSQLAELLLRAETLVSSGFIITMVPPQDPPTLDVDALGITQGMPIDITATNA